MLAGTARARGHEVDYFQFTNATSTEELENALSEHEVIGLTTMSTTLAAVLEIADLARRINPESLIVLGGPEISHHRAALLDRPSIDMLFHGECEAVFASFLDDPRSPSHLQELRGVSYRQAGHAHVSRETNIVDITTLPPPPFALTPHLAQSQIYLEFSRGCAQQCSFCMEHSTTVRFKTQAQMSAELALVESLRHASLLHIMDSDFAVSRSQLREYAAAIKAVKPTNRYIVQTRIDGVDEEKLRLMYESDVGFINFGLDNLSDTVLATNHKHLTWERIKQGLMLVAGAAPTPMSYRGNFIQGLPGETSEEASLNVARRKELLANELLLAYRDYVFMPVPRSPIHAAPATFNLVYDIEESSFRNVVPRYHYAGATARSGEEIYLHHLLMRTLVNDHFIEKYQLHGLKTQALTNTTSTKEEYR